MYKFFSDDRVKWVKGGDLEIVFQKVYDATEQDRHTKCILNDSTYITFKIKEKLIYIRSQDSSYL